MFIEPDVLQKHHVVQLPLISVDIASLQQRMVLASAPKEWGKAYHQNLYPQLSSSGSPIPPERIANVVSISGRHGES